MTRQSSFKRIVRARMAKTGESYAAARATLLSAAEPQKPQGQAGTAMLATSDAAIRERTGHGWEEWFDTLDAMGAADLAPARSPAGSPGSSASIRSRGTRRRSP